MPAPEGYAPYPLDDPGFGFAVTTISGPVGTIVVRHSPTRGSSRGTILLHGAAGSWTTWMPVLRAARDSGTEIPEPVLVDLPGWGDATLTDAQAGVDDLCGMIESAALGLGYTEWDVVGHSLGGFVALHLAATRAGRVRSVTSVSGTTWSVIERRGLPAFTGLLVAMRFLATLHSTAIVRGLQAVGVLRAAVFPLFRHPWRVDRSVITALAREVRPRAFVIATAVAQTYDPTTWAGITCPVTALKGDRDVFVRDDDLARLARLLPQAHTVVVPDCGHFATVEHPGVVVEQIRRSGSAAATARD